MSPRPTPSRSVSTDLDIDLIVTGGGTVPVLASMRYDSTDPYAVHIGFCTGDDDSDVVEWTFARQLLADGVTRPVGEGDVQVGPSPGAGRAVVALSLSSPSGQARFELPLGDLVQFLTRTYTVVPTGTEGEHVDLDAELALLLGGEPGR